MSLASRIALGIAAAAVAALLVLGALNAEPSGERGVSSGTTAADTGPRGLSGWAALLGIAGHDVERVEAAPGGAELDPDATAVLIDPFALSEGDSQALGSFVADGGRLVIGGTLQAETIDEIAGIGTGEWIAGGPATATPLVLAPETVGVEAVSGAGDGRFEDAGEALPALGQEGAFTLLLASHGEGRIAILADPSPLRNAALAEADNARLALALAGEAGRPVSFLERVRARPGEGLGALPSDWLWAFGGMLLAGLALIAARARRLSPPQEDPMRAAPPRRLYLDAMAASLTRTRDRTSLAAALRQEAMARLRRRGGLPPAAGRSKLDAAAAALGLDEAERAALLAAPDDSVDPLHVARGLAKLSRTRPTTEVNG